MLLYPSLAQGVTSRPRVADRQWCQGPVDVASGEFTTSKPPHTFIDIDPTSFTVLNMSIGGSLAPCNACS